MVWLSLIPAVVAIVLTFKTKKLVSSLFAGVLVGALISKRELFSGITAIGGYIADAAADKESAYTLAFLIAFGSLAELIEMAGGISGFSEKVGRYIKDEKGVLSWAWLLSAVTFFDSTFHTIAVGTILSPLVEKVKGSKDKFAFILSVTSLQMILLIPIATGYLGYMVNLVANNIKNTGITESAYLIVVKSVLWNFFSWIMIILGIGVTILGIGFGRMRIGKAGGGEELTKAHLERESHINMQLEEYPRNSLNLIVPVAFLIVSTIFFFWWTGRSKSPTFFGALSSAQFSVSIFAGVLLTLFVTSIFYMFQKISLAEIEAHIIGGGEKVLSLVIILVLSWALTGVTQDLGFSKLFSPDAIKRIPMFLIPAVIFLVSGAISYTIGSSWATWALIMPLAVSFSVGSGVNISLMVGTVWAGGAVADIVSPLSADMARSSYGEHLATSFPFVLLGVALTTAAYLVTGFVI